MKLILLLSAIVFCVVHSSPMGGIGSISIATVGAAPACVVAANKLYVNNIYMRDLNEMEQEELKEYKKSLEKHTETAKQIVQQAKKEKMSRATLMANQKALLEGPARPSFCSGNDTLPHYFDGCMVQNNKLYVGREFIRSLTEDEVVELKEYEEKKKEFQKYLSSAIHQQVQSLFGRSAFDLWSLFGEQSAVRTTEAPATTTLKPVDEPESPDFCTAIH